MRWRVTPLAIDPAWANSLRRKPVDQFYTAGVSDFCSDVRLRAVGILACKSGERQACFVVESDSKLSAIAARFARAENGPAAREATGPMQCEFLRGQFTNVAKANPLPGSDERDRARCGQLVRTLGYARLAVIESFRELLMQ